MLQLLSTNNQKNFAVKGMVKFLSANEGFFHYFRNFKYYQHVLIYLLVGMVQLLSTIDEGIYKSGSLTIKYRDDATLDLTNMCLYTYL